jgi:HAE1 family hydrophobic/amphiphilic exporter-1
MRDGKPVLEAAVDAAPCPFPADPDDVVRLHPRRAAAGAGERRRRQCPQVDRHHVFTGMIASTCLAVLFVPSLFVLIQRFEEWRKSKKKPPATTTIDPSPQAG